MYRPLLATFLLTLSTALATACPGGGLVTDDDASGDDDTGSAGDDDDMWTDDDDDDDTGDDDDDTGDDDDTATGDPCTVSFGPPEMPIDLTGVCEESPDHCLGGFDPQDSAGTCDGGMTCCVDTDQCEDALMGSCAAVEDDCDGEPPPGAPGFPQLGCPSATPYCCLPEPPQ